MSEQMQPITISIPSVKRQVTDYDRVCANNLIRAMREVGMDPRGAASFPIIVTMAKQFRDGSLTKGQLQHCLRNMLAMNPHLAQSGKLEK